MTKERLKVHKPTIDERQIMAGALLVINVIALIQLLSVVQLDIPLKVSLYCFAASIPLLTLSWLNGHSISQQEYYVDSMYDFVPSIISLFISFAGICALFWHFSWTIGVLFMGTSVLAWILGILYYNQLREANKS
jgi:hypothetical protein